ncbi:ATP-binding protein [Komarekiella sp. 'clone 1']|uniref:ATP-binding protein n=1 Tax=Komarekiella delphini-convector SJRDD-AB1 TaxID=2593771 RepID=A0AA40VQ59_9NOST|nr:ATP-binding protein [Komarekiella delphini-convector]MBD6615495.1 ATP-binding protein [Komarekiella delphini-convector SJRDD-AB1]
MQPSLTVPATLDSLSTIAKYVLAATAAAGLDKKAAYRCRLAIDEIATNIITYGYGQAGYEGVLDLQAEIDEQALTISIEDTGLAYDPCQTQLPDENQLKLPLEERSIGGLGIYLALHEVDKFLYERVDNKNRNIFIMFRMKENKE